MHSPVNWALLGLVIERPSYAYELARRFERIYGDALELSSVSHVYTALASLRERGLIVQTPSPEGRPRSKRRYEPTAYGVGEHERWLVGQVAEERRRQRVLIAQIGALAHDPKRALDALEGFEQACIAEMANAPAAGSDEGPGTTRLVARLTGEEARLTIAARLRWAQYARSQLLGLQQLPPGGG
jgi:DNA-binding PadR family transcriptional regulator